MKYISVAKYENLEIVNDSDVSVKITEKNLSDSGVK